MAETRGKFSFTPVGQDRRRPRGSGGNGNSEVIKRLVAGETLLMQGPKSEDGKTKPYSTGWTNRVLKGKGLRAVTRQDPDGTVVWAVPVDLPTTDEHTYDPTTRAVAGE